MTKSQLESIAQLQRFYQNADLLDPTAKQAMFSIPMEEHIKKGEKYITQWIRRNAKTIKKLKQMRKKTTLYWSKHHYPIFLTHDAKYTYRTANCATREITQPTIGTTQLHSPALPH